MYQLELEREFNVPVEKLFEFWIKPELMQRWFAPGNMTVHDASAELNADGKYRVVMNDPDDDTQHIVGGTYKVIETNKRLVFTWQWDGSPVATLVDLLFTELSDSRSKLMLKHSEFSDQESCDKHRQGWNGCLVNLGKTLTRGDV